MLFVVGYHASGKSHFARLLAEHYGAMHVETSEIVRALRDRDAPGMNIGEWAQQKEDEYGTTFFDELIVDTVKHRYAEAVEGGNKPQEVIVTGNRALSGILYAAENLADLHDRPMKVYAVDVSDEVRYDRFRERNRREGDATISFDAFQELMQQERETGLDDIFAFADRILHNEGTIEQFMDMSHRIAEGELGLKRQYIEGEKPWIRLEGNGKEKI